MLPHQTNNNDLILPGSFDVATSPPDDTRVFPVPVLPSANAQLLGEHVLPDHISAKSSSVIGIKAAVFAVIDRVNVKVHTIKNPQINPSVITSLSLDQLFPVARCKISKWLLNLVLVLVFSQCNVSLRSLVR